MPFAMAKVGVGYDHFVEYEVGERTHEEHDEAGNTDEKDFLRNTVGDRIIFEREIDNGDVFVFAEQADEVDDGDDVGEHGCDRRALYTESEREDEDGVEDDVHDAAERKTDTCFLGVALRAHEMSEAGVQNGGNTADGDRPEEIVGAVAVGELVRSEKREERGTGPIENETVDERENGGAPDTEGGAFFRFFTVAGTEASRDQTGSADTEEVGDTRQHDEGRHGEGCGGYLIGIVHLTDEEGVRHVIDHGDDLADDGWDNEGDDRF